MTHILAIDQGTTSTRAILFDQTLTVIASAQEEFDQHYPKSGWVEHDPADLWSTTAATCRSAIEKAGSGADSIAAIGITNQRETTLVWDRATGKPVHNAIVWQDRRTSDFCKSLKADGFEETVTARTGLLLDPYFSGTKLAWILDNVEGVRSRAEAGELLFGTVDSWLVWNLTGGRQHVTDATNAARTMLYDIHKGRWSQTICDKLNIPKGMLPEVRDCAADFGETRPDLFGRPIPILGIAGDQQAATVGQACFEPGMLKSTYGTGCFALINTGKTPVRSENRLLTTIAYQLDGEPTYALEGSIFIAGAVVQWLRDGLGIIDSAAESQALAEQVPDGNDGVYLVPAFVGLGAPHWDQFARGTIVGLTRGTGKKQIVRAALESIAYQVTDVVRAMQEDSGERISELRVDGGASVNNFLMQFQSDMLNTKVTRPAVMETTALGAAYLAGLASGFWKGTEELKEQWVAEKSYEPGMEEDFRQELLRNWQKAVERSVSWLEGE